MVALINDTRLAAGIWARAAGAAARLAAEGIVPGLAVVLVGEDAASEVYARAKIRHSTAAGLNAFEYRLPASTSQEELLALVHTLNADDRVDGILVQCPCLAGWGR